MGIFKYVSIKDTIEIKVKPEKIWNFFLNIEKNYIKWHPKDHVFFKWVKGNPMELGSEIDSEENVDGKNVRIKATVIESDYPKRIVFKPHFPVSLVCISIEWIIKPKGNGSVFIAIAHQKFGLLFRLFHRNGMDEMIKLVEKHQKEEGENLKKLLEK